MSPARREAARGRAAAPFGPELALFWVSALALFLELLLIRWVSTEIRIFAYLQNTVLVVCFLGLGAGLFSARRPVWIGRAMWSLVVLMALLAIPFSRRLVHRTSELLSVLGGLSIWNEGFGSDPLDTALRVLLGLTLTFAVMALILPPFLPIGRLLGRLLDAHPRPILAYSLNLLGSLTGVWLFVLLSWLQLSPVWWFAVFGLISLPLAAARGPRGWIPALPLLLVVILSRFTTEAPHARETVWSPYQKLALYGPDSGGVGPLGYTIEVNNVGYQAILDLRPETVATTPDIHPAEQAGYSQYDIPLRTHPAPSRVLIVGAGAGNDAAGALRQGAERVTAVEIDPAILDFGRRYHPERPYESERVRVVTDDARSFFAREDEAYDLIIFGLLDSHTTTAMTNARLDHYVYTRESIERARDLLAEGGVLALGFEAAKPFIADRMAGVLREAFGEEPIVFRVPRNGYGWGGVLFLAGDLDGVRTQIAGDPRLASLIATWKRQHPVELSYSTAPTTDDWPYVYLERRRVPALYFLLGGLMVLLFLYVRRAAGVGGLRIARWSLSHWHFFFLGGAFLLLEVQNISKASVALGNTWVVNAVIISAVLSMVLAANLIVAARPGIPLIPVYAGLLASAVGLYFVDLARFAFLPFGTKAVVVGGLTTLPMAFAGIVFVRSFAVAPRKDLAFGANLFGALAGALLQSMSFVTGIRALLLIVAAFYALAMLTRPGSQLSPYFSSR